MKFYLQGLLYLMFCLFMGQSLIGQSKIYSELKNEDYVKEFKPLFTSRAAESRSALLTKALSDYKIYDLGERGLEYLHKGVDKIKTINIPVENKRVNLVLKEVNILSPNYRLTTKGDAILGDRSPTTHRFYHGFIEGDSSSMVSLTVNEDHLNLTLSDRGGNYEINAQEDRTYLAFRSKSIKLPLEFECGVEDVDNMVPNEKKRIDAAERSAGDCVEIYFEADHQFYLDRGSDINVAEDWFFNVFNQVAILYANEGIPLAISEISIWTSVDPYSALTAPNLVLNNWAGDIQNNYVGNMAHFVSGKSGGGIAWRGNVICHPYSLFQPYGAYGVSFGANSTIPSFPTYSWNVMVISHELGHNFGSHHTHSCVWNGNNTAIDGCGNVSGCADPGNPVGGGTIMSYCHTTISGINFNLGFGSQPGDVLRATYNNISCNNNVTCSGLAPSNDLCQNATLINVLGVCAPTTYRNTSATASGSTPGFSCGNQGSGKDVWFKLTVSASDIDIQTTQISGGLSNMVIQVYTGSCGNLTQLDCDDNSGSGNHAMVSLTGLTINDQLFIRVIESGSNEEGLFGICATSSNAGCGGEADVLLNFYAETGGSGWTNKSGWADGAAGNDCNFCSWYGVACVNGSVAALYLESNGLSSSSFPSSIFQLTDLQHIYLRDNGLGGSIPNTWSSMTSMSRLLLDRNAFTGTLPSTLGSLNNLIYIFFYENNMSGNLPSTWSGLSNLQYLHLSSNNFSGSLPNEVSSMSQLRELVLRDNAFSGGIPNGYTNLTNLMALILDRNNLSGPIPSNMSNLSLLQSLFLYNNNFSGSIPSSLGSLSNLGRLLLDGNALTGSVPTSLGNLSSLEYLYFYDNNLSGNIPEGLGDLPNIVEIYGHNNSPNKNNFTGCFPATFSSLCGDFNFVGNPLMPNNGDPSNFCTNGVGADSDFDGFCDAQDCDESNPLVNFGATEICDGIDNNCNNQVDENVSNSTNQWQNGGGSFMVVSNWSLNNVPSQCNDVVIPDNATSITITIPNGSNIVTNSIYVGTNITLSIDVGATFVIQNSDISSIKGSIVNNGTLEFN